MHLSLIKQKLSTQHPGERKQLLEKNVILSFPRSEECGVDAPVQLRQQRGHEPDTQRAGIQSQRRSSAEPASLPEKKKKVNMWTHSELINDAHCSVVLCSGNMLETFSFNLLKFCHKMMKHLC